MTTTKGLVVTEDPMLTPGELVARWKEAVTESTLATWRSRKPKKGPSYLRVGGRVRYRLSDVIAYERSQRVGGAA